LEFLLKPQEEFDIVQGVLHKASNRGIVFEFSQSQKDHIQIQLAVNPCDVSKASSGKASHTAVLVTEKGQTLALNPPPIGVVIGRTEQSVQDIGFIGTAQKEFYFCAISLRYLTVFHHYR
jgi:hypothetical protein